MSGTIRLLTLSVESRLIVGAAAAGLVVAVSRVLGVPVSAPLTLAVMAATTLIYILDRGIDRRSTPGPLPRGILLVGVAAGGSLLGVLPLLAGETRLAILLGLPLCLLYAVPLPISRPWSRPKDHPVGKALMVATLVTGATVLLPLLEAGSPVPLPSIIAALSWVFPILLVNAVACDLRDVEADRRIGQRTIATELGGPTTRALLALAAVALGAASLLGALLGLLPRGCLVAALLLTGAIVGLGPERPRWAWGLCLDGALLPLLLS